MRLPSLPDEKRDQILARHGAVTVEGVLEVLLGEVARLTDEVDRLRDRVSELEPVEHDPYDAGCNCRSCRGVS